MKYLFSYKIFENEKTRTKPLTQEEFVNLIKTNCTQFNFENDQLYRGCGDIGEFAYYHEKERLGTYGDGYPYYPFFQARNEYPVPRYKSIIGSTSILAASVFGMFSKCIYLIIPFDNSKVIICPGPDMAAGVARRKDITYTDEMFTMIEYSSNFHINKQEIQKKIDLLGQQTGRSVPISKAGVEIFTNSDCLFYCLGEVKSLNVNNKINQELIEQKINHLKQLIK